MSALFALYLTKVLYHDKVPFMKATWNNSNTDQLASALISLKNIDDVKAFLRDLLTEKEIIEFGKRWQVAQLLNQNLPYSQIESSTGLSSTTIARVSKFLKGGMQGYQRVLDRQHHQHTPHIGERS